MVKSSDGTSPNAPSHIFSQLLLAVDNLSTCPLLSEILRLPAEHAIDTSNLNISLSKLTYELNSIDSQLLVLSEKLRMSIEDIERSQQEMRERIYQAEAFLSDLARWLGTLLVLEPILPSQAASLQPRSNT